MEDCISICEGKCEPKRLTVGEEFIAWAETYYKVNEKLDYNSKDPGEKGGESMPYEVVRDCFIQKINDLIKFKLAI